MIGHLEKFSLHHAGLIPFPQKFAEVIHAAAAHTTASAGAAAASSSGADLIARQVGRRLLIAQIRTIALVSAASIAAVVVLVLVINQLFKKLDENKRNLPALPDRAQVEEKRGG